MDKLTRFTCEHIFERLDDWIDRELSPEESRLAREHLATCEICAREYGFNSSLLKNVKQKLRRIEGAPDLMARISGLLERERRGGGEAPESGLPEHRWHRFSERLRSHLQRRLPAVYESFPGNSFRIRVASA
jgi:hypothetical protein